MKNTESIRKRTKLSICIALALLLVAGATMALLNQVTSAANNSFAGGIVNVAVNENGTILESGQDPGNTNSYNPIQSGVPSEKVVQIQNKNTDMNGNPLTTVDTLVRVRLVPCFRYNDGTEYAGQIVPMDMSQVSYDINSTNWIASDVSGQTYYYYNGRVTPGNSTEALMNQVTYAGEVPEDAHFELQVLTEGISAEQAGYNGTQDVVATWNNAIATQVASN